MSGYWKQVKRDAGPLSGMLSNRLAVLRLVFGVENGPVRMGPDSVPILRCMAVASEWERHGADAKPEDSVYSELAELAERHGEIEVWGDW